MPIGNTFDTSEPELSGLLEQIHTGEIQLPDFQRDWVWDDLHIRSLIASITLSYPIGAVMLLEVGGESVKFAPRPLEGVNFSGTPPAPELLILDGQQRLTSLYLALRSGRPVHTRTEKDEAIDRVYYLDLAKCLDDNVERMDAIIGLPPERILRSDFGRRVDLDISTREKEFEHGLLPASLLLDPAGFMEWRTGFQEKFGLATEKVRTIIDFERKVWIPLQRYKLPAIKLLKSTTKDAVCQVFEKVNTGGVALTVFELVTATFAADGFRLREDWKQRSSRMRGEKRVLLEDVAETDFLQTVTLLSTYRRKQEKGTPVSAKRRDILRLSLANYQAHASATERGYILAWRFLAKQKIFSTKDLPYAAQLIPLAAVCAELGERSEEEPIRAKLERWFWCGIFGELYGGANETRFALDVDGLLGWIAGGMEPRTIVDSSFTPIRLLSMQSRLSAAYKGVMAGLLRAGSVDLLTGDPIEVTNFIDEAVDIHHLFPRKYCEERFDRSLWNSIVNKAPLTARTNRIIGGDAPSAYLPRIERTRRVEPQKLGGFLRTHLVDPALMREDRFADFMLDRAASLLDMIETLTGKAVSGRDSDEVKKGFGAALRPRI
jgi:hypothetical protein